METLVLSLMQGGLLIPLGRMPEPQSSKAKEGETKKVKVWPKELIIHPRPDLKEKMFFTWNIERKKSKLFAIAIFSLIFAIC